MNQNFKVGTGRHVPLGSRIEAVETYLRRAEQARERAEKSSGVSREAFRSIALGWETLAAETLLMIETTLKRDQTVEGV